MLIANKTIIIINKEVFIEFNSYFTFKGVNFSIAILVCSTVIDSFNAYYFLDITFLDPFVIKVFN